MKRDLLLLYWIYLLVLSPTQRPISCVDVYRIVAIASIVERKFITVLQPDQCPDQEVASACDDMFLKLTCFYNVIRYLEYMQKPRPLYMV